MISAQVLLAQDGIPALTVHPFGKGFGVYLSEFRISPENTRLLRNLLLQYSAEKASVSLYLSDDPEVECAYWPQTRSLAVVNNSGEAKMAELERTDSDDSVVRVELPPFGMSVVSV